MADQHAAPHSHAADDLVLEEAEDGRYGPDVEEGDSDSKSIDMAEGKSAYEAQPAAAAATAAAAAAAAAATDEPEDEGEEGGDAVRPSTIIRMLDESIDGATPTKRANAYVQIYFGGPLVDAETPEELLALMDSFTVPQPSPSCEWSPAEFEAASAAVAKT